MVPRRCRRQGLSGLRRPQRRAVCLPISWPAVGQEDVQAGGVEEGVADEVEAAVKADVGILRENCPDELGAAPARHVHHGVVALAAGADHGRRTSDGQEEEEAQAQAHVELPPEEERHCWLEWSG